MRKSILIAVLILSIGTWAWCDLRDHYRKGKIVLKGATNFGDGNDWESLFYDRYKDIAVSPDGLVFVVNTRTHNIFKFNKNGKFIKKFGRRGKGPGDFFSPDEPTILDNKYLVVAEYPSNRRFSLWDFNGKCVKIVNTKTSIFFLTATRDNWVAYYYYNRHANKKNGYQTTISIVIKNISTGKEKILKKINLTDRSGIDFAERSSTSYGNFFGEVFLTQTGEGNLAVGVSNQPNINIYSPTGTLIRSFDLKIARMPVSRAYIGKFRDDVLEYVKDKAETSANPSIKETYKELNNFLKTFDFFNIFDKYLPLYNELTVDSEGNILVFKFTECLENCNPIFRVYSEEGEFICETVLDKGQYKFEINRKFRVIRFTSGGIFVLAMKKDDENEVIRLIKSSYLAVRK